MMKMKMNPALEKSSLMKNLVNKMGMSKKIKMKRYNNNNNKMRIMKNNKKLKIMKKSTI
jgi:hypothetical protein